MQTRKGTTGAAAAYYHQQQASERHARDYNAVISGSNSISAVAVHRSYDHNQGEHLGVAKSGKKPLVRDNL